MIKYIIAAALAVVFVATSSIANERIKRVKEPFSASVAEKNKTAEKEYFSQTNYPQHYCLALNIYHESRGSNLADMAAVANVVINRANDRRYPDTICGVVHQGKTDKKGNMIKNQCQFSWYCDGKPDTPVNRDAWIKAQMIAFDMLEYGRYRGLAEGATHYHANYVSPNWAKDLTLVGRIGEHVFYRWEN